MIVLDTNVISELMRGKPDQGVVAWVRAQPRDRLFTTHVNEAEIFHGIRAMPEGRRRDSLAIAAETLFAIEFRGRVLPLGQAASRRYGDVVVARRDAGRPIGAFDALIAAIAFVSGASVATRDTAGFDGTGVTLVNPWSTR